MSSSRRATRRGIVHVIDAFLAATLLVSLTLLSVYIMYTRTNTQVNPVPDPSGVDEFVRSNLEAGRWQYYIATGKADRIADEIKGYLSQTLPEARVRVVIYATNSETGTLRPVAVAGDTLMETRTSLQYFVPLGGWLGGSVYILEVDLYW